MKKLLFLTVPLMMVGVVALTSQGADANYADFDISDIAEAGLRPNFEEAHFEGGKFEYLKPIDHLPDIYVAQSSLLLEDPTLKQDTNNLTNINNQKQFFNDSIGKGVDMAAASAYAFENNEDEKEHVFDSDFLNKLYQYGNYKNIASTVFESICRREASSQFESISNGITVSVGVEASYACVKAELTQEYGFSTTFSSSMSEMSAVYSYNWMRKSYQYNLPYFQDHSALYKNHLSTHFQNDLAAAFSVDEQSKYEELFQKYGSHILMSANYGAASTVNASIFSLEMEESVATEESVSTTVGVGLEVNGYGAMATTGFGTTLGQAFGVSSSSATERYRGHFYGGDPVSGGMSLSTILANAREWTRTVDNRPVCIQYKTTIPIWDLLTGTYNQPIYVHALQNAFRTYQTRKEAEYLSEAAAVKFGGTIKDEYHFIQPGKANEEKVAHYWDKTVKIHKQASIGDSSFIDPFILVSQGYTKVRINTYLDLRATKKNTKLTFELKAFGYTKTYNEIAVTKQDNPYSYSYASYTANLIDGCVVDSNIHFNFKTNSGGVGSEKVAMISNLYFTVTYLK